MNTLTPNKISPHLMILYLRNLKHYCPVKVDETFFEIIEIQSTTALFKGATI